MLEAVVDSIGLDGEAVLEAARSDAVKLRLRQATEEAIRLNLFGAPSFVTPDGEVFWGNDRLEMALSWAGRRP